MEGAAVRKTATSVFVFALVVAVFAAYVFLVFYENTIDFGAGWITQMPLFSWVVAFSVMLILAFILLLILYFAPSQEGETEFEPLGESEAVAQPALMPLREMQELEEREPVEEPAPVTAEADALLVRCTNCQHDFEIPYQTARPIYATCPKCGEEAVLEEGEDVLTPGGVPVADLEGIGPVFERRLASAGITTSEQLRRVDASQLAESTGIAQGSIENWQAQADFIRMDGVGKQLAELLALAGYRNLKELSEAKPEDVVKKVRAYLKSVDAPPTKTGIDIKRARTFVAQAKQLSDA